MQNVCLKETDLSQERFKAECVGQSETLQNLMDLQHTILKNDHREYCWWWIGALVVLILLVVVVVVEQVVMVVMLMMVVMVVILMMVMMVVMVVILMMVMAAHLIDKKSQMLQLLRWEVTWLDWLLEDSVHQEGKTGQGACVQSPERLNSIT